MIIAHSPCTCVSLNPLSGTLSTGNEALSSSFNAPSAVSMLLSPLLRVFILHSSLAASWPARADYGPQNR